MRTCGECTACCVALAVQELDKPRYQSCAHLSATGCGNYEHRPGSCRDYQCLWLQGHLAEEDRPDKLGVIFTVTRDPDQPGDGNMPMLIQCVDGAVGKPRVLAAIQRFMEKKPVVILTRNGRNVLPPVQVTVEGRPTVRHAA